MVRNSIPSGSSGKTAQDENFPVASFLLPKRMRSHVMAFYAFARTADDIADSSSLNSNEKISQLDAMENILLGGGKEGDDNFQVSLAMRQSLSQSGVSAIYCRDLLKAFRQDANKNTYASWDELMNYCSLSAAPVGRYLITLSSGNPPIDARIDFGSSDALCAALQILNHIQDMKEDYIKLGRVYLPADWMAEEGVSISDLDATQMSPALKKVTHRALVKVDGLLDDAAPLAKMLQPGALGREAGGIRKIATQLSGRLKNSDPVATRVELGKVQSIFWFLFGAVRG
ncbi:MAG: squalene synthase HpnC [Rhodospirillaceae bacterium]|nr:squalene synthase HpnC [Rhodospirillaceae bacterium]